jgi:hypothetical protein
MLTKAQVQEQVHESYLAAFDGGTCTIVHCTHKLYYICQYLYTVIHYTGTSAGACDFLICSDSGAGVSASAHRNENPIYVFPEKELRDLSPKFHIHVSVNDLFIPTIGLPRSYYRKILGKCGYLYVIIYTKNSYMYLSQN